MIEHWCQWTVLTFDFTTLSACTSFKRFMLLYSARDVTLSVCFFFTEQLWEYLSLPALDVTILKYILHTPHYLKKFPSYTADDQCRVNFALKSMGLEWSRMPDDKTVISEDRNGLNVVVLPQTDICRHICITNSTLDFYVSHPVGGAHNGTQKAHKGAWFLRQDWNSLHIKDTLTGIKWLKFLHGHKGDNS